MPNTTVPANTPEQNRFTSIGDFKTCMRYGGEVEIVWKERHYGIFRPPAENAGCADTDADFSGLHRKPAGNRKMVRYGGRGSGLHGWPGSSAGRDHAGYRARPHHLSDG